MLTPEGRIKADIVRRLQARGCYVFTPTQMGYGRRTVDILACCQGYFIAIECKPKGVEPTIAQKIVLKSVENSNGIAILANSWHDVECAIERTKTYKLPYWPNY